ncbi:Tyrosine decarboxylase [Orchesella cincta]|uniref:Tyrosine decarboxylase n=1 Tax=Orchesella cincta TaxID=48709 RepID=A0A1D2MP80_ORCCI|nr:Tyrosine decarboxylase [Orchesella cincta]
MIGMTHWQHPRFHAYFPSGASYPSILADIVGDVVGCIGFSWASGPACTELEGIVLDWLAKMMNLPPEFMHSTPGSKGGGCIQTSASECVLVSILAARALAIQALKRKNPDQDEAYCSKEAHSCVEKGAMIAFVKLRILETDDEFCLRGNTLQKTGLLELYPFFVSTTVGTTSCCSADNLNEIGPICKEYDIWLHVMLHTQEALRFVKSSAICLMESRVKDRYKLTQALVVDPLYLQHSHSEESIDYRHWGIPLSRRFRALKLWFQDPRFEIMRQSSVVLGLLPYERNQSKKSKIAVHGLMLGKLHMVPASLNDKYVIRFCVCREEACESDMGIVGGVIKAVATEIEKSEPSQPEACGRSGKACQLNC